MKTWFVKRCIPLEAYLIFFLCNFLVAWFVYLNYAGDYKMTNKNQKVSSGFPMSM